MSPSYKQLEVKMKIVKVIVFFISQIKNYSLHVSISLFSIHIKIKRPQVAACWKEARMFWNEEVGIS